MPVIQHRFICRPSDSTVSEDALIEPRTVATLPFHPDARTTRLDHIIIQLPITNSVELREKHTHHDFKRCTMYIVHVTRYMPKSCIPGRHI
jgi:hypothetical protein